MSAILVPLIIAILKLIIDESKEYINRKKTIDEAILDGDTSELLADQHRRVREVWYRKEINKK